MTSLPLEGLKIVDLSRILAGPFATQILGDLGAEVIKVESPNGDDTRSWGPPFYHGQSVYFLSSNRNKESVILDLDEVRDLERLHGLLANSDILVENFKVDGLKRWGLDFASLREKYPKLIYCSITGFGQTGPYAHRPGYDALIQAMGGLMSITGTAQAPCKVGVAVTDLVTGLYAVIAVLAAVLERENSKLGQHIDISLLESQISLLSHRAMDFLVTGLVPQALGNAHPNIVPYQTFNTADGQLFVAIGNDLQFANFCEMLCVAWHSDPRFSSNPCRVMNKEHLIPKIQLFMEQYTSVDLLKKLLDAGVPAAPVNNLAEVAMDPQVIAREIFTTMDDGNTPCVRSPIRFSRTPILSYRTPRQGPAKK